MRWILPALSLTLPLAACDNTMRAVQQGDMSGLGTAIGKDASKITSGSGCTIAAAAGAVAGGVGGYLIGGKNGTLVTLGGAALGGLLGSQLCALLSPEEQEAVAQQTAQALQEGRDGQPVQWEDSNGLQGEFTTSDTRTEKQPVQIVRDRAIETPENLEVIGGPYRATTAATIRSGPSRGAGKVASLAAGDTFTAAGQVRDPSGARWILIEQEGVATGYVTAGAVTPARQAADTPIGVRERGSEQAAASGNAVVETVTASTKCRTATSNIKTTSGESATNELRACKGSDGTWEIL